MKKIAEYHMATHVVSCIFADLLMSDGALQEVCDDFEQIDVEKFLGSRLGDEQLEELCLSFFEQLFVGLKVLKLQKMCVNLSE